ncbi:MAG: EAL domain-containing protein, partial [Comamonadaceae bacterium]
RVILHQALRNAIAQNELELYYQPKISAQDGHIHGFEALLRWNHPQNGLTGPGVFIPLAERFGLIGTIGAWVIEQACAQLGQWKREGVDCRVAINLSPHQLRNPRLPQLIEAALRKNHIEPSRLVCEITETALMENVDSESEVMKQIAALGVRLSIDDFGTGYSSLAHLRRVPAKQLKIDRSFVADLEEVSEGRAVVNAIVQLAHALSIEVVAEGVETHEQLRTLRELGCDVLQGYAIARPMPAGAVARWLAAEKLTRDERLQPGTAFAPV